QGSDSIIRGSPNTGWKTQMAHDSYIPIPKDLTVAVVCSDPELSQASKKVLGRILITMVESFERGEDAIKRFQTHNFDMLYMHGDPIDMTAFTLIRAARSGAVSAIFPAALVVDEDYYLSSDEKDFLQSYSVTLIKT